jgi:predicted bacteriocin transport accessory protein
MKKIFVALTMILLLCGCSSKKSLETINYSELKEKIENKESFVLYIHKTGCTHCENYEPILKEVLNDYNLTIYSLNTANLSDSESNSVKEKFDLQGTPTLIYVKNGSADTVGSLIGEQTYDNTKEFLIEYGYINEGEND